MNKEVITNKQMFAIITMFLMGSTLVLGAVGEAKQSAWLAIIFGTLFAVPIIVIYAKTLSLFPGKDVFEIMEMVFGKIIGKATSLLFTWFAFHLGALVIRNFGEFITTVSIPETPKLILMLMLAIMCIWIIRDGIEVLGRWTCATLPILLFIIITIVSLSLTNADVENLKPVLEEGFAPVLSGAFGLISFPYAETVLLMATFNSLPNQKSSYKVYLSGLFFGGLMIFIITLRNILVLGADTISLLYFPSYVAVSKLNIGDFFQRVELMVSIVFIFSGFVKISICLLAACKGISKVLNIENYRFIVAPVGLMMVNLAYWIYNDIIEMEEWAFKIWKYYAFPFQVILPVILLAVAVIRLKIGKLKV